MQQTSKLKEFYTSLDSINAINTNLDKKRNELKFIIDNFNTKVQKRNIDENFIAQSKQLGGLLNFTIDRLKSSSNIWVKSFTELMEREKFRSDFENYFIIIIYGKVKAGKSSLGNFIAKNNTSKNEPIFFKYDETGNEQSIKKLQEMNDEFAVKNVECTTEIQGFRLNGLAWIDTPGLGSMVEENGQLAKKYIQNADYIIFPTSSNEPERLEVMEAIDDLLAFKKTISICITQSDTKERQKDSFNKYKRDQDGNITKFLVNKSIERRREQESSFIKSLRHNTQSNLDEFIEGDIISISVHTAQEGLDRNDDSLFINSNITKFYELITNVVRKKASLLKASVPYNSLLSFLDRELLCQGKQESSLKALKESLNYFNKQIQEAQDRFETIQKNTTNDIITEVEFVISQHISDINKNNSKQIFILIDKEINEKIEIIINNNIKEILENFTTSLESLNKMLSGANEFEIKDKYEKVKVRYQDRSLLNVVTFGLLGRSHSYITENVLIGNNKGEIILNFKMNRTQVHVSNATANYNNVVEIFFKPLSNMSNQIKKDIENLEESILIYKNNLKDKR